VSGSRHGSFQDCATSVPTTNSYRGLRIVAVGLEILGQAGCDTWS